MIAATAVQPFGLEAMIVGGVGGLLCFIFMLATGRLKAKDVPCSGWYHTDEDPLDVPYGWEVTRSYIPTRWKLVVGPWRDDTVKVPRVTLHLATRDLADDVGSSLARLHYNARRAGRQASDHEKP